MKEIYAAPEMEITLLETADVITTSGPGQNELGELDHMGGNK